MQIELIAAASDWLVVTNDSLTKEWIAHVLLACDSDPWRRKLWPALANQDRQQLVDLAAAEAALEQPPRIVSALARQLKWRHTGCEATVREMLTKYVQKVPNDFWIHNTLGQIYMQSSPPEPENAARHFAAALAIREDPLTCASYGNALLESGRYGEAEAILGQAVTLSNNHARAHELLAKSHVQQGEFIEARKAAVRAIESRPDQNWVYATLAEIIAGNREPDVWIDEYRQALPQDHNPLQAEIGLGNALERLGYRQRALSVLQAVVDQEGVDHQAYATLGSLHRWQREHSLALEMFGRADQSNPTAESAYQVAVSYENLQQHEQAAKYFRLALSRDPQHIQSHRSALNSLYQIGEVDEALRIAENLTRLQPRDAHGYGWLGFLYLQAGNAEQAAAFSERSLELDADQTFILRDLADAYCQLQRWGDAARSYARVLQQDRQFNGFSMPKYEVAGVFIKANQDSKQWRALALSLMRDELAVWQARNVTAAAEQILQHTPSRPDLWLQSPELGGVRDPEPLRKLPEDERAAWHDLWRSAASEVHRFGIALITKLGTDHDQVLKLVSLAADFDPSPAHLDYLGWLYLQRGQMELAKQPLREALRLDPNHRDASRNLTRVLWALDELPEALSLAKTAARLAPSDAYTKNLLAQILLVNGQWETSLTTANEALKLDPQHADCWLTKATAAAKLERFSEAASAYLELIERGETALLNSTDAARALVIAGSASEPGTTPESKARLRTAAIEIVHRLLDNPEQRSHLQSLITDEAFAAVREPQHLAELPEQEQTSWRAFWAQLDAKAVSPTRP